MILPFKGLFHLEWYPKTASTLYTHNDAVEILNTAAGAGTLALVSATSTRAYGLVQGTYTTADATTDKIPVLVGDVDAEYLFDVSTGSAAVTDIGEMVDFDDENSIDVNAYTLGQVLITGVISATQVTGKFNKGFGKEIPITQ